MKLLSRLFSRATGARPVSHSASGQRAERLLQACLQPSRTFAAAASRFGLDSRAPRWEPNTRRVDPPTLLQQSLLGLCR